MITVDAAEFEHPKHQAQIQAIECHVEVKKESLDFGDYAWIAHPWYQNMYQDAQRVCTGIEVSTVMDLLGKRNTGRFGYQMAGMLDAYDMPMLLIKGPCPVDGRGNVTIRGVPPFPKAELDAMVIAAQCAGVLVFDQLPTDQAVADMIVRLYRHLAKPPNEHKLLRDISPVPQLRMPLGPPLDDRLRTLMGCPAMGEERARNALARFGSVQAVMCATVKELETVPMIGRKSAEAFVEFVNGQV